MQTQNAEHHTGIKIGEIGMKIYRKGMMYDSDPSLRMDVLESGAILIYSGKPDDTMNNIWKRSVLQ